MTDRVLILDFGSQVTQLIARRVRESGVYCEIHPYTIGDDRIAGFEPRAVILSGGPASVSEAGPPDRMTPRGAKSRIASSATVKGWISQ